MSGVSLLEYLSEQDCSRPAVVTETASASFGDLTRRAYQIRDRGWPLAERAVANSTDLISFLEALVGYEGWAEAVFLQSVGTQVYPDSATYGLRPLPNGNRTRLVLTTSGTTGLPKLISHTLASLTATTKRNVDGGSKQKWGLLYDPAKLAGVQVVLQALLGGSTLIAPGNCGIEQAVDFMAKHGVTALSATPSCWRQLLLARSITRLPLKQITLGGEIADERILHLLRARFPSSRIVHIYASTETGVAFSVRDGKPGFPRAYLTDGALSSVRLRITPEGRLLLRKTDPELQPTGVPILSGEHEGFVDTGDLVEVRNDRVFFLGRASGLINVGGIKVCPEKIEAVLCSHHQVAAARAFGKASSLLGNLVAAEVQVRDLAERNSIIAELNELCRAQLTKYERPTTLNVVDRINISNGKIARSVVNRG